MEVHLENVTDKNIRFIAENYCTLTRKLDDNNKITDTQLAYQVKVNYLSSDVEKLKKDVAELNKLRKNLHPGYSRMEISLKCFICSFLPLRLPE